MADPILTPEQIAQQEKLMRELSGGKASARPAAAPAVASPQQVQKQNMGIDLLRNVLGKRERDAGL